MTNTDRRQGQTGSLAMKEPVRVATTANITLSGLQTIDAIALAENDRVLVWVQTDAATNGIYVASSGAWSRATDFDGSRDITSGTMVYVVEGTNYAGAIYVLDGTDTPVIDTDDIDFRIYYTGTGSSYSTSRFKTINLRTGAVRGPLNIENSAGDDTIAFFSNPDGVPPAYVTIRDSYSGKPYIAPGTVGLSRLPSMPELNGEGDGFGGIIDFQSWSRTPAGSPLNPLGGIVSGAALNAGLRSAASGAENSLWEWQGYYNGTRQIIVTQDNYLRSFFPGNLHGVISLGDSVTYGNTGGAGDGKGHANVYWKDGWFTGAITAATLSATGFAYCGKVQTVATTLVALGTAAGAGSGTRAWVTDANETFTAANFGATATAGGANAVPVISDGTNWKIG